MAYIGRRIAEWERAIEHRSDIQFTQMNLRNGRVESVIGTIQQPCKRKYKGQIHHRTRKVRWNCFGFCTNLYGVKNEDLGCYNIFT